MNLEAAILETAFEEGEGYLFDTSHGKAEVVGVERRERDSWGEGYEGDSGVCSVIIKFPNGRVFEYEGYESSYSTEPDFKDGRGPFEVYPRKRTVTEYRRK